jgi:hypothetical protein
VVEEIRNVLAIAHQPTRLRVFAQREHRWQTVVERQFGDPLPLSKEDCVRRYHDRWHVLLGKRSEGNLDFL